MQTNTAVSISDNGVFLFHNGKYNTAGPEHPNIVKIKDAVVLKKYDEAEKLMDVAHGMNDWAKKQKFNTTRFTIDDGVVYMDDQPFSDEVSQKVINMMSAGQDADALINFLRKTKKNPSATAQKELLLFCHANDFLIHRDGDIIAFKGISDNWFDKFTGTLDNHVGNILEMERNEVDDNRDRVCSYGLHFGAIKYATDYGNKVIVVKVNPKDVVSIPSDYHNEKGRCCRYEVVAELKDKAPLRKKEVYSNSDFNGRVDTRPRCSKCNRKLTLDEQYMGHEPPNICFLCDDEYDKQTERIDDRPICTHCDRKLTLDEQSVGKICNLCWNCDAY